MNKDDELAIARLYLELVKLRNRLWYERMDQERRYQEECEPGSRLAKSGGKLRISPAQNGDFS